MKIGIVTVPYFLSACHRAWAEAAHKSMLTSHEVIPIAVVNGIRAQSDDAEWLRQSCQVVLQNDKNILARAWNCGIREALRLGARYVIVANTDIVFHPCCIDNLVTFADQHPELLLWSANPWRQQRTLHLAKLVPEMGENFFWSCFMVDGRLFNKVGHFDEHFRPAYLEDADMRYRIKLSGENIGSTKAAVFFHRDCGTIKGILDGELDDVRLKIERLTELRKEITANDRYFEQKWGGLPGQEKFRAAFDGGTPRFPFPAEGQ